MFAFMNREALAKKVSSARPVYFSLSRGRLLAQWARRAATAKGARACGWIRQRRVLMNVEHSGTSPARMPHRAPFLLLSTAEGRRLTAVELGLERSREHLKYAQTTPPPTLWRGSRPDRIAQAATHKSYVARLFQQGAPMYPERRLAKRPRGREWPAMTACGEDRGEVADLWFIACWPSMRTSGAIGTS